MRSKNATAPLDHIFYALSDPTRRTILTSLGKRGTNVTKLAQASTLTFPTISKHLRVLERAKLIRRKVDPGDARAFVFEPDARALHQASLWIERQRGYWEDRFDELETFVTKRPTGRESGRR